MSESMARKLRGLAGLASTLALVSAAAAGQAARAASDRFEAAEATARALPVLDASGTRQLPFAGFTIRQPDRVGWVAVAFYAMFREVSDGEARRRETYWIARRIAGTDAPRVRVPPEIHWASSDTCPDLDVAIRTMGDAVQDQIELAVPGDGDASESTLAAARYGMWSEGGRFRGTSYAASLQVTAIAGSPLASWIDLRSAALATCWLDAAPPTVTVASP